MNIAKKYDLTLLYTYKFITSRYKTPADNTSPSPTKLRGHSKKVFVRRTRTQLAGHFYSNRVVDTWNKLQEDIISAPTQWHPSRINWESFPSEKRTNRPSIQHLHLHDYSTTPVILVKSSCDLRRMCVCVQIQTRDDPLLFSKEYEKLRPGRSMPVISSLATLAIFSRLHRLSPPNLVRCFET